MKELSEQKYAGFWMRFAALLVDQAMLGFALGCIGIAVAIIMVIGTDVTLDEMTAISDGLEALEEDDIPSDHLKGTWIEKIHYGQYPAYIAISILYHAFCEATKLQGSIGKFILQIQVIKTDGTPTSFIRSFMRNFLAWTLGIFTLSISHWFAGFTKKKRALHDMATGCVVIRKS